MVCSRTLTIVAVALAGGASGFLAPAPAAIRVHTCSKGIGDTASLASSQLWANNKDFETRDPDGHASVFDKSANLKDMFDKSALKARDAAHDAKETTSDAADEVRDTTGRAPDVFKRGARDAEGKAQRAAEQASDTTGRVSQRAKGDAEHKGLGSRIKSAVGGVKDSVARAANKAEDGLADALHDPLE
ncbi:hypothetical protein JKP88DRAFT_266772 [Tribonema minus]|uniref:Uncharacterized protein n=1 Tax=Tribonema minus TaxID=303371 RepID=A0A836CLB8_9STRA|nr:hypothetical protein JKP88DRAFT_266772 [Tribonema minus]